jgi:hypothetical protein
MSKKTTERSTIGTDGKPLPILPADHDGRVWAKLVRVMFYTPGFFAVLLLKAGEPAGFGIAVELLMLSSAAALVGGLFIGTQAIGAGADASSKIGIWSGALVMELLAVVPFLCAVPVLFKELARSTLLHHATDPGAVTTVFGLGQILPAIAIVPFVIFQLAGFGMLNFIVPRAVNLAVNTLIVSLITAVYYTNFVGLYSAERISGALLMLSMVALTCYGILKLKSMQADYDRRCPLDSAENAA